MSGQIQLGLNVLGVQDAKQAADELQRIRQGLGAIQGLGMATPFPQIQSPMQGLGSGRLSYEDHMRVIADMAKQTREVTGDYAAYERQLLNVGKAYGYTRDQALQAADAMKQITSMQERMALVSGGMGFARGYGMDPGQVGGQLGAFQQMGVGAGRADQSQFMFMLSEAVAKGSTGGMTILMERFLPILQDLSARQLAATPSGVNPAGIANLLARFDASGVPGLRDQGGAAVYGQLDQGIKAATGGFPAAIMYEALAAGNPNYDYAQYRQDIAQGASNPESMKRIMTAVRSYAPPGNDDKSLNWASLYANQVMPGIDPATWKTLLTPGILFDQQGGYIPDRQLTGLRDKYGAGKMDPTYLGLLTRTDQAKGEDELQQIRDMYKSLTGKDLSATLSGNVAQDRQAVGTAIGATTTPAMNLAADQKDRAVNDAAKAYEDSAQAMNGFSQKLRELNDKIAQFTRSMTVEGSGAPYLAAIGMGSQLVGSVFQGTLQALVVWSSLGAGKDLLGRWFGGGGGATPPGGSATPGVPTGTPPAGGPLGPREVIPTGGPASLPTTAGGGFLATAGPVGLAMALYGGLGALGGGALDHLGGGQGRDPLGLPLLAALTGPLAVGGALGIGAGRWLANSSPLASTGVGAAGRGADDWMGQHVPGYSWLFGHATGGPATLPGGKKPPSEDKQDDQLTEAQKQTELLAQINAVLGGRGTAFDNGVNARYGAAGAYAPRPAGATTGIGPATGSGTVGVPTGGVAGPNAIGTPGAGFGNPSRDQVAAMLKQRGSAIDPDLLVKLANEYGVPVSFALAYFGIETSLGTAGTPESDNFNYGNLVGSGSKGSHSVTHKDGSQQSFALYGSQEEGIRAAFSNLARPLYQGKSLQQVLQYLLIGPNADPNSPDGDGSTVAAYLNAFLTWLAQLGVAPGGGDVPLQAPGSPKPTPTPTPTPTPKPQSKAIWSLAGLEGEGLLPADSPYLRVGGPPAVGRTEVASQGATAARGQFFGTVELVIKQPDGSTDRQWVELHAGGDGATARIINYPRGRA